jgi:hypothetical protein
MSLVSTESAGAAQTVKRGLLDKLNAEHHKSALLIYTLIVLAHWAEHLAQAIQVYALGWPLRDAGGLLGMPFPWLVKSEFMHYSYALLMLAGFWLLRRGFVGLSRGWWTVALWIQVWHHVEHALLQFQAIYGQNFFGAPTPISIIQMLGMLEGSAATGFNGLMTGPPQHPMSLLMLFVRRLEVHMFYNTIVFIPMVFALYYHTFPSPGDEARMSCTCSWQKKAQAIAPAVI